MRFSYQYQDKAGFHTGEIRAGSESEAYSLVRKSGIHPMKVWPSPGLLNRLSSIGKRGYAIIGLALALVVAVYFAIGRPPRTEERTGGGGVPGSLASVPRRQLPPVDVVFAYDSEATLALFARPGDSVGLDVDVESGFADLDEALAAPTVAMKGDSSDAILLRRIVAGLKDELRQARAAGESIEESVARLVSRQRMEVSYRAMSVRELRDEPTPESMRRRLAEVNASLRTAGIRQIDESEVIKEN